MNFSSVIKEVVLSSSSIGGGDIGHSYHVVTAENEYFVKHYSVAGMSCLEAKSLGRMSVSGTVTLPEVINSDEHFLVLRYIEQTQKCSDFQARLGQDLARMHRAATSDSFGFPEDNYIGSIVQKNSLKADWIDFFIENRIDFQVELAGDRALSEKWNQLRSCVPGILAGTEESPCLIHGDLWGGNVISGADGGPVLIDPAAYYAHREMELGMTRLFGGFTSDFYSSYNAEYPLKPGWQERINIYILYHVLNHFNMFGGGYRSQALSLMKGYL